MREESHPTLEDALIHEVWRQKRDCGSTPIGFRCESQSAQSAWSSACSGENDDTGVLVAASADINIQDVQEVTPLHHAVDMGIDGTIQQILDTIDWSVVGMLLDLGADPSIRDSRGETVYDIANACGYNARMSLDEFCDLRTASQVVSTGDIRPVEIVFPLPTDEQSDVWERRSGGFTMENPSSPVIANAYPLAFQTNHNSMQNDANDRTEWSNVWSCMQHRIVAGWSAPALTTLVKQSLGDDWNDLQISSVTATVTPPEYGHKIKPNSEMCPSCGCSTDPSDRFPIMLYPTFNVAAGKSLTVGFACWMHSSCVTECPLSDEPTPIPW